MSTSVTSGERLSSLCDEASSLFGAMSMGSSGMENEIGSSSNGNGDQQTPAWMVWEPPAELAHVPEDTAPVLVKAVTESLEKLKEERKAEEEKRARAEAARNDPNIPPDSLIPIPLDTLEPEPVSPVTTETMAGQSLASPIASSSSSTSDTQRLSVATASITSECHRRSASVSTTTSSSSKTRPMPRKKPKQVTAMGPLGLTTFYAPVPTNEPPSYALSSPSVGGVKRFLKDRKEATDCASCFETLERRKTAALYCQHSYCFDCFKQLVMAAIKDERCFPPRCCLEEIPPKLILSHLNSTQKREYEAKSREYTVAASIRWYCPKPTCGRWIDVPTKRLANGKVKCPHCKTRICRECRGEEHKGGEDCPKDFALQETLKESSRNGWRRCYKCRAMVELAEGCRHITCKCRAEFCYVCGVEWGNCACELPLFPDRTVYMNAQANANAEGEGEGMDDEIAEYVAAIDRAHTQADEERSRVARLMEALEERRVQAVQRAKASREALRVEEIQLGFRELKVQLHKLHDLQLNELNKRHDYEAKEIAVIGKDLQDIIAARSSEVAEKAEQDSEAAKEEMERAHPKQVEELDARHEEEEDDYFLGIRAHLRGKPNREAREKAAVEKVKETQREERDALIAKQKHELEEWADKQIQIMEDAIRVVQQEHSREQTKWKQAEEFQMRRARGEMQIFAKVQDDRMAILQREESQLVENGAPLLSIFGEDFEPPAISSSQSSISEGKRPVSATSSTAAHQPLESVPELVYDGTPSTESDSFPPSPPSRAPPAVPFHPTESLFSSSSRMPSIIVPPRHPARSIKPFLQLQNTAEWGRPANPCDPNNMF